MSITAPKDAYFGSNTLNFSAMQVCGSPLLNGSLLHPQGSIKGGAMQT